MGAQAEERGDDLDLAIEEFGAAARRGETARTDYGEAAPDAAAAAAAQVGAAATLRDAGRHHQAVAPAVRDRRGLGHRPGRRLYRRRHRRRAGGRRGQDRGAVRLSADPARPAGAARRHPALDRIVAGARHRLPPARRDAHRPLQQARFAGAGLSGAAPLGRSDRAGQPGHRDDRIFLRAHRGAGAGRAAGAGDGAGDPGDRRLADRAGAAAVRALTPASPRC